MRCFLPSLLVAARPHMKTLFETLFLHICAHTHTERKRKRDREGQRERKGNFFLYKYSFLLRIMLTSITEESPWAFEDILTGDYRMKHSSLWGNLALGMAQVGPEFSLPRLG